MNVNKENGNYNMTRSRATYQRVSAALVTKAASLAFDPAITLFVTAALRPPLISKQKECRE